jgi:pantoate--beta-alanine ligase
VTDRVKAPTIGIGAGVEVSGKCSCSTTCSTSTPGKKARFVKNFMAGAPSVQSAIEGYVKAVKAKTFPGPEHQFPARRRSNLVDVIHTVSGLRERPAGVLGRFRADDGQPARGPPLPDRARQGECAVRRLVDLREPPAVRARRRLRPLPRTLERDCEMLRAAGCHVVFAPDEPELYPEPQEIRLTAPKAADQLCGPYRPGHFEGVLTVVCKLFDIVCPQVAVFGSKDYQQLHLIRMMVRQLNFGIEIISGDTVREADGLAMSSRNGYLNAAERKTAVGLYTNLKRIKDAIEGGSRASTTRCAPRRDRRPRRGRLARGLRGAARRRAPRSPEARGPEPARDRRGWSWQDAPHRQPRDPQVTNL